MNKYFNRKLSKNHENHENHESRESRGLKLSRSQEQGFALSYSNSLVKSFGKVRLALVSVLVALMTVAMCLGLVFINHSTAYAEADQSYFYKQIQGDRLAKSFYEAIADMDEKGYLKQGTYEYDLIGSGKFTKGDFDTYSTDTTVMEAFGAARDAYSMDHPELFYVDFDYLSVSVGTKNNGSTVVATLGTGRGEHYLASDSYLNETTLNTAISDFNNAVNGMVNNVDKTATVDEQIRSINRQLLAKVTYTYIEPANSNGTFIHNPYGALVNGRAVCEGYARAFKILMDKLGIECVLVRGYAQSVTNGSYEPHMWNEVKINNLWYAVDTTWNDGDGIPDEYYLLLGSTDFEVDHEADGYVSASGKEFSYPALNAYNYGASMDNFTLEIEYANDEKTLINIKTSYDGKSAQKLFADTGKYLAIRFSTGVDANGDIQWTGWQYLGATYLTDSATANDKYSLVQNASTQTEYMQLGVINIAPNDPDYGSMFGTYVTNLSDDNIFAKSQPIGNGTYGSYVSEAFTYAKASVVGDDSAEKLDPYDLDPESDYIIYITADEELTQTGDLSVTITRKNGTEITAATASDYKWDTATKTFSFKLHPSQQYGEFDYMVKVNGLTTTNGGLEPKECNIRFWRKGVVCSKVFNDGRLWMSVYGSPTLVAHNDITVDGMKDENGNDFTSNQRSQLLLVVEKPDSAQDKTMVDMATNSENTTSSAVKASETYEIDMLLCGCVAKVPEGSYMQVAFGFPEGYGPEDAGVTFKVYHYKKDANGNITGVEEVEAVVTEYGIIATVESFSPFAIVAYDSAEVKTTTKGIYARTVGVGGSVSTTSTTTAITTLKSGESVTYNFTPETGYELARVLVNGEETTVAGNTLTLAYADLTDNTAVEAFFVSSRVAAAEKAEGITVVYPKLTVNYPTSQLNETTTTPSSAKALTIVIIVLLCVVIVALAVAIALVLMKKRKATASANGAADNATDSADAKGKATKETKGKATNSKKK